MVHVFINKYLNIFYYLSFRNETHFTAHTKTFMFVISCVQIALRTHVLPRLKLMQKLEKISHQF